MERMDIYTEPLGWAYKPPGGVGECILSCTTVEPVSKPGWGVLQTPPQDIHRMTHARPPCPAGQSTTPSLQDHAHFKRPCPRDLCPCFHEGVFTQGRASGATWVGLHSLSIRQRPGIVQLKLPARSCSVGQ